MAAAPRILVVDDNEALRENIAEALELEGYAVTAVGSGARALETLASEPLPAVVLIDVRMPGMSGTELVGRLRDSDGRPKARHDGPQPDAHSLPACNARIIRWTFMAMYRCS